MIENLTSRADTSWFHEDRFGLFVHWGLYTLPSRDGWLRNTESLSNEQYEKYFRHFDPDLYDPGVWARAASAAGMRYAILPTKHHEGFCLWDSALTSYKATNTPAGRDLLEPMVEAFRAQDMKVGFYHSLLDWHHDQYTIDHIHPQREDPEFIQSAGERDISKYRAYLHGQTRELLTRFGRVSVLWYDFSFTYDDRYPPKQKEAWGSEELISTIRGLQPWVLINDRLGLDQDFKTAEQYQPRESIRVDGRDVAWEACQTISGSWGYNRDESGWKPLEMLVKMLVDTVAKGGNLLLNVGPTARGELDPRDLDRLAGIGEWMKRHSRSIYGCGIAPTEIAAPEDCRLTYHAQRKRLYIHLFSWPFRHLHVDGLRGRVEYAQLLGDASEIRFAPSADDDVRETVTFDLPVSRPNVAVPVIEVYLK